MVKPLTVAKEEVEEVVVVALDTVARVAAVSVPVAGVVVFDVDLLRPKYLENMLCAVLGAVTVGETGCCDVPCDETLSREDNNSLF